MPAISHTFHVVDELPHRASVFVRDEDGEIHTYVSRTVPIEARWADLGWAFTALADTGDYERVAM